MSPGINSLQLKMLLEIKGHISTKLCIYSILLATSLCPPGLEVLRAKYESLCLEYLILYMDNQWDFQNCQCRCYILYWCDSHIRSVLMWFVGFLDSSQYQAKAC